MALAAATTFVGQGASATVQTKWYTVSATPTTVDHPTGTSVTFTVTNCGLLTAGCGLSISLENLGSFEVVLPSGWTASAGSANASGWSATPTPAGNVLQVHSSGTSLQPGQSLRITTTITPSAGASSPQTVSIPAKASSDFSGTGNDFQLVGSAVSLTPRQLVLAFSTPPADLQIWSAATPSTICPAVQVQDGSGHPVAVAGVPVTLTSAGTADPLLTLGTAQPDRTEVTKRTDSTGTAVFNNSSTGCDGLRAFNLGNGFTLQATSSGFQAVVSPAFNVYNYFQPCIGTCTSPTIIGDSGTAALVSATDATGSLGVSVLEDSGISCGDDLIASRPEVTWVDLADGNKTITLTWTKTVTLADPRNGTPFWPVCMKADAAFVAADADGNQTTAQPEGSWFVGLLPDCDAGYVDPAQDPCKTLSRTKRSSETATISLPLAWAGDPAFH